MSATNIYSGPQSIDGTPCIWLQGCGLTHAKPAADLQVGDTMIWNYGSTSKVVAIRHKGKSVFVTEQTKDGKVWPERRFLTTRLVAIGL